MTYRSLALVLVGFGGIAIFGSGVKLHAAAIQVDLDSDAGLLYFGDGPAQVVDGHGELGMTWLTGSGNGAGDATLILGPPDIVLDTGLGADAATIDWGMTPDHTHASSSVAFYQNNLFQSGAWSTSFTIGARVSGLAPGNYRVYAIAVRPENLFALFDVGIGINDALVVQTGGGIGFGDPAETQWVAGKNYVFRDVTVGSTSDFVTITSFAPEGDLDNPNRRSHLQGFQIVEIASAVPGDFDSDNDVDGADFVAWQTHFPTASGATLADGDADGDGDVDGADFVVWQTNFPFTPGSSVAPVPEPKAFTLLALGGLAFAAAKRRKRW